MEPTCFVIVLCLFAWAAAFAMWRSIGERWWAKQPYEASADCVRCRYSLVGLLPATLCPECGWPVGKHTRLLDSPIGVSVVWRPAIVAQALSIGISACFVLRSAPIACSPEWLAACAVYASLPIMLLVAFACCTIGTIEGPFPRRTTRILMVSGLSAFALQGPLFVIGSTRFNNEDVQFLLLCMFTLGLAMGPMLVIGAAVALGAARLASAYSEHEATLDG